MSVNASVVKIRNIHKNIQEIIEDISIQNNAKYLFDPIESIWKTFDDSHLRIDVLYLNNDYTLEWLQKIDNKFTDSDLKNLEKDGLITKELEGRFYRVHDADHFPVKSTKKLPYLIKVILCNPDGFDPDDISYFSQRFVKESAITFVKGGDKDFQRWLKSELNKLTWRVVFEKDDDLFEENLKKFEEHSSLINLIALILGTRKILNAIDSTIENEYKDLSARKISVQNDHMKLKKKGSERIAQDLFSTLKNNLQRSFSEFENGINSRFSELTKNQPGSLYSYIIDQIDGIHSLEEAKVGGETKYILPSRTLEDLENESKNGFQEHLEHDVQSLNDYLDITKEEINKVFKENGLNSFNYKIQKLSNSDFLSRLDDQFHFEKQYESKSVKKGFMSFFSAVRQPYMIIIMMVGLLGRMWPKDWLPEDENGNPIGFYSQTWFLILMFLALVAGIYFAVKSSKKKKKEAEAEELKKVSQWLKSEYKRIFSSVEKDWKSMYFQHGKNEFSDLLRELENDLKNFQQDRSESISTETNLTQRKIQTLEAFDKKLKDSQRKKAKVLSDINGLSSDLKQSFLKLEI